MALIEKSVEKPTTQPKYKIIPKYGVYTEEQKIKLQVALPGVKKDAISMKALEDYFILRAPRDDIEYALDLDFGYNIEPEKTVSNYYEGLLTVEFKLYNPLEHAYEVKIE